MCEYYTAENSRRWQCHLFEGLSDTQMITEPEQMTLSMISVPFSSFTARLRLAGDYDLAPR